MLRLYIVGVYGEKEMHGGGASRGSDAGGGTMNRCRGGWTRARRQDPCVCAQDSARGLCHVEELRKRGIGG